MLSARQQLTGAKESKRATIQRTTIQNAPIRTNIGGTVAMTPGRPASARLAVARPVKDRTTPPGQPSPVRPTLGRPRPVRLTTGRQPPCH